MRWNGDRSTNALSGCNRRGSSVNTGGPVGAIAMRFRAFILLILVALCAEAFAQNNADLAAMFADDQAARRGENIDWAAVSAQDAERRDAVRSILNAGGVRTALDYYNAAMIFQHGDTQDDIRLAHAFATIAASLGDSSAARWLQAASWDRLLLRHDEPQWYGTQYVRDESGRWILYEVDPDAVTDEQRAASSVPSLAESQARLAQMNGDR